MTKPDFSKLFAQGGPLLPLTDQQYLQGFGYLGDNPPTVPEFNWLLQQIDEKLQWLNQNSGLNLWQAQATYAVGDIAYSPNLPSYAYAECTVAGTTAAAEPTWPGVGEEITDGTVRWRVGDIRGSGVPVGTIMPLLSQTPLTGFLTLAGQSLSRATYPQLWAFIQTTGLLKTEAEWQAQAAVQSSVGYYSSGDGSTTFRLPRLVDFIRGSDGVRTPGTWQMDEFKNHQHLFYGDDSVASYHTKVTVDTTGWAQVSGSYQGGMYRTNNDTSNYGGTETRPKSISMLYCVKAFDAATNPGLIDITALANEVASAVNVVDYITDHAKLLTANGYQKLPGGLIIQWGTVSAGSSVTFPVAFPSACLSVVAQNISLTSTAWANGVGNITKTGFTSNMGSSSGIDYIAIGC